MPRVILACVLLLCSASAWAGSGSILVLGDSLSAAHAIPTKDGWVSLLADELARSDHPVAVINASISGETTAGGLAQLPKLLAEHDPDWVLLELGANDGLRGLPLTKIESNLRAMIEACQVAGSRVLLIGIELPVNYGPVYRDGLRALYRALATEFKLALVPFLLEGVALDADLMLPDGLHPNAAGQPKVLANVWPVLQQAMAKPARH